LSSAPPSHWSEPFESDMVRTSGGSARACWGVGDVAGVSLMDGLSESVSDDSLDLLDDSGNESRVPSGEPSGVKMAGRSVLAVEVHMNWPCVL
jgi:hypothetical protein